MRLRAYFSNRPTRVYKFRYENHDFLRENGKPHFRVVTVPVGFGRFQAGSEAEAKEIADRRCSEAYGAEAFAREARIREAGFDGINPIPGYVDPAVEKIRHLPGAHHDGYVLVEVRRVK